MMILTLLFFLLSIQSDEPVIKSLQYYVNKDYKKIPVLRMNSDDKLSINFEIEGEFAPNLNIQFKFCDAEWKPYDNLLLTGIGENTYYDVNPENLPITTQGADYYVSSMFPNRQVKFKNSGKWMFFIVDAYDSDVVYDWGKFYVVENMIRLNTNIQNWRREGSISNNNAEDRVLNLKTKFSIPDSLDPFRIKHVEIIKNMSIEYPMIIDKGSFQKNRGYEWDGSNNFEFIIRDLEPGNEYRQVNLNDRNKYSYPITRAHFDGIEYSRYYQLGKSDFNGGFQLMNRNNEYSDYLVAKFEFSPPKDIYDDIFIVGAFTGWEVLPWFKLEQINNMYSINLELKRGVYDYQYVTGEIENDEVFNINWNLFEGNFWNTKNVYSIFLYYRSPDKGEYDQIIGFRQILR